MQSFHAVSRPLGGRGSDKDRAAGEEAPVEACPLKTLLDQWHEDSASGTTPDAVRNLIAAAWRHVAEATKEIDLDDAEAVDEAAAATREPDAASSSTGTGGALSIVQ